MNRAMLTLGAAIALAPLVFAQADSAPTSRRERERFDEFVRAVDAAHRTEQRPGSFDRFVGDLSIRSVQTEGDNIEVRLSAKFLAPDLLRYSVREADRQLERGRDAKGAWMRNGDHVVTLPGRDFKQDLRELKRHTGLARQLLRFLDPAATLRALREPTPVEQQRLQLGRLDRGACDYTRGLLDGFPVFAEEGDVRTVSMEVWAREGRLQAIRATPVDENGSLADRSELVIFEDYRTRSGTVIPTKLEIFEIRPAPDQPRSIATIEITKLDLTPELEPLAFTRPKS